MAETWLITGANRGLGLELARQAVAAGHAVIGTVREDAEVSALRDAGARVETLELNDPSLLAERLAGVPIDVLVNNAGRQYRVSALAELDAAEMADVFAVNALAPVRVMAALLPNLRLGARHVVVHVTSRMGSFAEFTQGNMHTYRASKAALNMFHRCISDELAGDGFTCVALHPGWVRTDMGGPDATLGVEDSAAGMLRVMDGLTPDDNGAFLNQDGATIDW